MPQLQSKDILDLDNLDEISTLKMINFEQIDRAKTSMAKLAESITIPFEQINRLQTLLAPSMLSIRDAQKALEDSMRPTKIMAEAIAKHAEDFKRLAEIGNTVRKQFSVIADAADARNNWQKEILKLTANARIQIPDLKIGYLGILDDIEFPPHQYDVPFTRVTPRQHTPAPIRQEDKEDIARMAADQFFKKIIAMKNKDFDSFVPSKSEIISGMVLENHQPHIHQLEWDGLMIDLQVTTLRYKDFPVVDISPETQAIKLLVCLLRKQGEIATNIELAVAVGFISPSQTTKTNQNVARNVQLIKKQVVSLLLDAGMSRLEVQQMIVSKRNIGFILRKSITAKVPQK
jgi:hypothetical protein